MAIRFTCASCDTTLRARDALAGKRIACPNCHQPVRVPERELQATPDEELLLLPDKDEPEPEFEPEPRPRKRRPEPPRRTGRRLLLVALAVVVLAGGGIGAYFAFVRETGVQVTEWSATNSYNSGPDRFTLTDQGRSEGLTFVVVKARCPVKEANSDNVPLGMSFGEFKLILPDGSTLQPGHLTLLSATSGEKHFEVTAVYLAPAAQVESGNAKFQYRDEPAAGLTSRRRK
jgi:hypothetical protein